MRNGPGLIAAIVPAAGQSTRMGQPKLTLLIGGEPLIGRVISALRAGGADPVIVVTPPADAPGATSLIDEATLRGALVVVPDAPTADMRASIELGLNRLDTSPIPAAVVLAPGDSPGLTANLVAQVIARGRLDPTAIIVPTRDGRHGHPLLIPWFLADAIRRLPPGQGVKALLSSSVARVAAFDTDDPGAFADLDTPEDYQRFS
jgi:molybdenum cofactor cytidylyltransferase